MITKVTEHGLFIPKDFLLGMDEVEIRQEHGIIIITPATATDPIFELGQNPVTADVDDASVKHDIYIHNRAIALGIERENSADLSF